MDYLTTRDVASRLKMSPRLVRNHISAGRLKASKLGKSFRVSEDDLKDFIEKGYREGEKNVSLD
jgi:excisionase family DNA binding protein